MQDPLANPNTRDHDHRAPGPMQRQKRYQVPRASHSKQRSIDVPGSEAHPSDPDPRRQSSSSVGCTLRERRRRAKASRGGTPN